MKSKIELIRYFARIETAAVNNGSLVDDLANDLITRINSLCNLSLSDSSNNMNISDFLAIVNVDTLDFNCVDKILNILKNT